MNIPYIADLHTHPSLKPFRKFDDNDQRLALWEKVPKPNNIIQLIDQLKLVSTTPFSQSNFLACVKGNNRFLFAVIGPIERTFFDVSLIHNLKTKARLAANIANLDQNWVQGELSKIRENEGIDYYTETLEERDYVMAQTQTPYTKDNKTYHFKLVHDYDSLKAALETPNTMAAAFSIEGMHCLLTVDAYRTLRRPDDSDRFLELYKERITALKKDWKDAAGNSLTPFYITLCHHFWNKVCGHGSSISTGIITQDIGKNNGFTNITKPLIDALLSYDATKKYRRILIDTKHMSPRSRMQFYAYRKEKYPNLPILASHTAVSGVERLIDFYLHIKDYENNPATYPQNRLDRGLAWSDVVRNSGDFYCASPLNLCDEDIKEICDSKGLIGIILNEDRLPGRLVLKELKKSGSSKKKELYLTSIVANLMRIREKGGNQAWKCVCIGSDYDGIINDMESYPSANEFTELANDLLKFLQSPEDISYKKPGFLFGKKVVVYTAERIQELMHPYTEEQVVMMLMHDNLDRFLKTYYHDGYLLNPDGSAASPVPA